MDDSVDFYLQGADANVFFTPAGIAYSLSKKSGATTRSWTVKLDFVGANRVTPIGRNRTSARISYFKGPKSEWETGIPTYSEIVYRELWPGVDLVYTGNGGALKYSFVVHAGADPSDIRLAYRGATSVQLADSGVMEVTTPVGGFTDEAPISYQAGSAGRVAVESSYALGPARHRRRAFGFNVGAYDPATTLVIDPTVLVYAGYIGGDGNDPALDLALDTSGNAYVSGSTTSTAATFPETVGPGSTLSGFQDAFVAKVDPAGSSLVYAGYIGGAGIESGAQIAVDAAGNAYVMGTTTPGTGFPATGGPDLSYNGGDADVFVAKINPSGSALIYAGFIGGSDEETNGGIAVDASGNAYVTGNTRSTEATFPETVGPDLTYNGGCCGDYDAFVAKVDPSGSALVYAGYIGGSDVDGGTGIAVDGSGNAFIAGGTSSSAATFPVAVGPDLTYNGGPGSGTAGDGFVAKITSTGSSLVYAGYIGGSASDIARDVAVDGSGSAFVTGFTLSTEATFPEVVGPDLTSNGNEDVFVAKVDASGGALVYSGYIGGTHYDDGFSIVVDASGNAYVAGQSGSTEASFPVFDGPDLTYNGGTRDAFVAKLNPGGSALVYSGYIGGTEVDIGSGVAIDAASDVYVSGYTSSSETSFPVVGGPDITYNGFEDAFVAKIGSSAPPPPPLPPTVQQLGPNDTRISQPCAEPGAGCTADVLSDKFDGVDSLAHLTVVARAATTRVTWLACPLSTPASPSNFDLEACNVVIGTDNTATVPASSPNAPSPTDEAYETTWDIPGSLDHERRDIVALACTGPGQNVDGQTPNCLVSVESSIFLEDAATAVTAHNQTTAGELGRYRTHQGCLGSNAPACDAVYKAFPNGSPVPNQGFDARAFTSHDVDSLQWAVNSRVDASVEPEPSNALSLGPCSLEREFTNHKRWRCTVPGGLVPDHEEMALSIIDANGGPSQPAGTAGYCNGNNAPQSAPNPRHEVDDAHSACVLDVHYIVSSTPSAARIVQSFAPNPPSPPVTAGCASPDVSESSKVGTDELVIICLYDQFGDPFNGPWTEQSAGKGRIASCGGAVAHTHSTGSIVHCHGVTGPGGTFSFITLVKSSNPFAAGTQLLTSCHDPEYGGTNTNVPVDHGCGNASASLKTTLRINWHF